MFSVRVIVLGEQDWLVRGVEQDRALKSASGAVRVFAIVAVLVSAWSSGSLAEPAGTVSGTVTLTQARRVPIGTAAYGRRGVAPKPSAVGPETQKVVVFLSGIKPASVAPVRATVAQRGEQFVPPVTAVTIGSTVAFPNEDSFFHNVFSLSRARTFDLGRYPSGESRERSFPMPGVVKVYCDIHAHMSALIMVLDHPWFTIPDEQGDFTLPPVPPGDYTLVAWHERIGEQRRRISVAPDVVTRASFTLPVLESVQ
jgi:plastocyanin